MLIGFRAEYQKMNDRKKWRLSTGKIVEDEVYNFGLECEEEQSVSCMHHFMVSCIYVD